MEKEGSQYFLVLSTIGNVNIQRDGYGDHNLESLNTKIDGCMDEKLLYSVSL